MAYARIPDTFPFAEAVVDAGNHAVGAWARMLAWTAGNGRDGFIPAPIAAMIATKKEIAALARSGLVDSVTVGEVRVASARVSDRPDVEVVMPADGFWLADFLTWNISAGEAQGLSARGRKAGQASAAARSATARVLDKTRPELDVEQSAGRRADDKSNSPSDVSPNRHVKTRQDKDPVDTERGSPAHRFDPIAPTAARDVGDPVGRFGPDTQEMVFEDGAGFSSAESRAGANAARESGTRNSAEKSSPVSRQEAFS